MSLWAKRGQGKTAVIVGAGPSVKEQLEWMKRHQDDFFWIVADTMLKPLHRAGVVPDLVCSLERAPEIVELLDAGEATRAPTLAASALLDPRCFEVYQGPSRLFFQGIDFEDFLPFKRSKISTGHSCIGVAMAMASLFGFQKVLLMGIDLCWSPEGDSHMRDVSYLNDPSYKKQNEKLWKDSIELKNSQGKTVRTNRYWALFRYQFEGWIGLMDRFLKAKVYNLSPSGLPLKGAIPFELKDAESLASRAMATELRSVLSPNSMPRMNGSEVKSRLNNFVGTIDSTLMRLDADLKQKELPDLISSLNSDLAFKTLMKPTLGPMIEFAEKNLDRVSIRDCEPFLNSLKGALLQGRAAANRLIQETSLTSNTFYKA